MLKDKAKVEQNGRQTSFANRLQQGKRNNFLNNFLNPHFAFPPFLPFARPQESKS